MLQNARRLGGNFSQICRFFGISRGLFYIWGKCDEKIGVASLGDMSWKLYSIRFRISPEIVSMILRFGWSGFGTRSKTQYASPASLSRLGLTDDQPEDVLSASRRPDFSERGSAPPKTNRCTLPGFRALFAG